MVDTKWLKQRRQGWYVRVRVPPSLHAQVGPEIVRSLHTKDLRQAQLKRHAAVAEIKAYLDSLRRQDADADIIRAAKETRRQMEERPEDNAEEGFDIWVEQFRDKPSTDPAVSLAYRIISGDADGLFLKDALDLHLKEIEGRVLKQTMNARKRRVEAFIDFVGAATLLADVTRKQAGQYLTEKLNPSGRSVKTRKDTTQDIGAFFGWCRDRGYIDTNPFEGISRTIRDTTRGTREKLEKKRRMFTEAELISFLSEVRNRKGWDSPEFAIVAICLFTGMRPEEVCRIETKEVSEQGIFIPETKTESSVRTVPIHPVLKPLVDHWKKAHPEGYLLGDLPSGGEDDKAWNVLGKRVRYILRENAKITDPAVVPYSLRHNFKTALRRLRLPEATIDQIMGHSKGSEAKHVYDHGETLGQLQEAVNKVDFGKSVTELMAQA